MRSNVYNKSLMVHMVKSLCLRSITLKYGAYYSVLAYATYKMEYQKRGATKSILQIKEDLEQLDLKDGVSEQLFEIINDTYRFIEEGVVSKTWITYNQNIRGLFKTDT